MNDPELYQTSNTLQKRDVLQCLEENAEKIIWKNDGVTVIDIGSGDGSVTSNILKKFLPYNYKKLVGCDLSEEMVQFANAHHATDRTSFTVLDIAGDLPNELRGNFDHAFSFFTFHWIKDQETAFTNIYRLLAKGGNCLLLFVGNDIFFDVYRILARTVRWRDYMKDVNRFISPYQDSQNPEEEIKMMISKIGYTDIEVKCKEKSFVFTNGEALKNFISAVDPFKIPPEKQKDYLEDYMKIYQDKQHEQRIDHVDVNHHNIDLTHNYRLLVVSAKK